MWGIWWCMAAWLLVFGTPAEANDRYDEALKWLARLQPAKAHKLVREPRTPLEKALLARIVAHDRNEYGLIIHATDEARKAEAAKILKDAIPWLTEHANEPRVATALGHLYYYGVGVEKDVRKAVSLWVSAEARRDLEAATMLGGLSLSGEALPALEKDEQRGFQLMKKAADGGDSFAQFEVFRCFENGGGVQRNEPSAALWLRKAAAAGHSDAMLILAMRQLGQRQAAREEHVEEHREAFQWVQKAAEAGNAKALMMLGLIHETGMYDVKSDAAKALEFYRRAAQGGLPMANLKVAINYRKGIGTEADKQQGRKWLASAEEAAKRQGDTDLLQKIRGLAQRWDARIIAAPRLLAHYEANEVAADLAYKGKVVEVDGQAERVAKDIAGNMYMTFKGTNPFQIFRVQCFFGPASEKALAAVRPGRTYTVYGKCRGKLGNVLLEDCQFAKDDE
jgi:TPR repeat protein